MYCYVINKNNARVELYIDTGDKEKNKRIFDELYSKKDQKENASHVFNNANDSILRVGIDESICLGCNSW